MSHLIEEGDFITITEVYPARPAAVSAEPASHDHLDFYSIHPWHSPGNLPVFARIIRSFPRDTSSFEG